MQRPMRRKRQELSLEEAYSIVDQATSGVLALVDDGLPYAVPLSHARVGGTIFFHCATEGRKVDALKGCARGSFCVIGQDPVAPERFTTYYRSAVAEGPLRIVDDEGEKLLGLRALGEKFSPGDEAGLKAEIDGALGRVLVLALDIESLTGKEAIELTRMRAQDDSVSKGER